mgnify:CR=1 FL=1
MCLRARHGKLLTKAHDNSTVCRAVTVHDVCFIQNCRKYSADDYDRQLGNDSAKKRLEKEFVCGVDMFWISGMYTA